MCIDIMSAISHSRDVKRATKTGQVQIRVTPAEKRELMRRARAAGVDLSAWVLGRLIPPRRSSFHELVRALAHGEQRTHVLAGLGDLLSSLDREQLADVTDELPPVALDELAANQLAAMIETKAAVLGVRPPAWTEAIEPRSTPWFPTTLLSVRLHLLRNSPPAFRRRNLFVDATLEDRV